MAPRFASIHSSIRPAQHTLFQQLSRYKNFQPSYPTFSPLFEDKGWKDRKNEMQNITTVSRRASRPRNSNSQEHQQKAGVDAKRESEGTKIKNIQQQEFADGHPLNYYSADLRLMYGRADGMPISPQSMAVCERLYLKIIYYGCCTPEKLGE